MNTPANTKILLRESAGASYLILTAGGEIRRWWPKEALVQGAELTAEAVAAFRAAQGWTLAEMGEKMAVGKSAVANWEKGIRRPALANLRLLYIAMQGGAMNIRVHNSKVEAQAAFEKNIMPRPKKETVKEWAERQDGQ